LRIPKAFTVSSLAIFLLLSSGAFVSAQEEESFIRERVLSKRDAFLMSAVYPGLGQMTNGQRVKGVTFFLAETISLVYGINAHENYNTKNKIYERDIAAFNKIGPNGSGTYEEALVMYNDLKSQSDDLDNLHSIRNAALIAGGAVYLYNIFDALVFSPGQTTADNSNRVRVQSAVIDHTPGILLSKSF